MSRLYLALVSGAKATSRQKGSINHAYSQALIDQESGGIFLEI